MLLIVGSSPHAKPLSDLITLVFNFALPTAESRSVDLLLRDVSTYYPDVTVIVGTSTTYKQPAHKPAKSRIVSFKTQ